MTSRLLRQCDDEKVAKSLAMQSETHKTGGPRREPESVECAMSALVSKVNSLGECHCCSVNSVSARTKTDITRSKLRPGHGLSLKLQATLADCCHLP